MASGGTDSKDVGRPIDPTTVRVCKTVRDKGRKSRAVSMTGDQFEGETKYAVVKQASSSPKPRPSLDGAFKQRSLSHQSDSAENVSKSQGRQRFNSLGEKDKLK